MAPSAGTAAAVGVQDRPDAVLVPRTLIGSALRDPASLVLPPKGWPARYAARRIGWHVLDHLREIEEKSDR
jgi:hypothetical protein